MQHSWCYILVVLFCMSRLHESKSNAVVTVVQPVDRKEPKVETEDDEEAMTTKVFKPEKYWKKVQPDETVPRGLHVRMNINTGEKEARLLDEQENNKRLIELEQSKANVRNQVQQLNETEKFKFRDMETINKEFEELDLKPVTSESHTIQELLDLFRNGSSTDDGKQHQLKEMEYLLHQYDVAKDFVKMGGIRDLIKSLNNIILRNDAALALGAALQGNPEVQKAAAAANGIHSLLVSLESGCSSQCVFSLSALLRQNPRAQKRFISEGGAEVLANVYKRTASDEKTKLKIVTLVSDLLIEREYAMAEDKESKLIDAYSDVNLSASFVQSGFCELITSALSSRKEDVREKVLHALHGLVSHCDLDNLVPMLESLRSHYKFRMNENSRTVADEYFESLYKLTDDLIKHITDENHLHSEL